MQLIRGLYNCSAEQHGCVASIGNFDGMHVGHQEIFRQLAAASAQHQLPSCVISFEPLPYEYFKQDSSRHRLLTLRDKVALIEQAGADRLLLLRFNQAFAMQPASDFIEQTLVRTLGVKYLVVGDDFRFGHQRSGDFDLLQQAGKVHGFDVDNTRSITVNALRASSSSIRKALLEGDCQLAKTLLGRPYRISGRVIKGEQIGRQLGYPTANVALKKLSTVPRGVFVVTARTADGQGFPAMANLGSRPTVSGIRLLLEVHLFDVNVDLYGQILQVDFDLFLRSEKKFDSLDELKLAIDTDARAARAFHQLPDPST